MNYSTIYDILMSNWLIAFSIVAFSSFLSIPIKSILADRASKLLEKDRPLFSSFLTSLSKSCFSVIFAFSFYIAIRYLQCPGSLGYLLTLSSDILITLGIGRSIYLGVEIPCGWWSRKVASNSSKLDNMLVPVVEACSKVIVVGLIAVQIIQILSNQPITSIIAGLGIGGLAFALAAQDTIKNLFGSIMLMCDRPFDIGDRINVGGHDGPVTKVGLRSTTIENLDGHKISIPNSKLADMFIQNIGVRPNIKRVINILLHSDTPAEKVEKALEILRRNIQDHEGQEGDLIPRVYLSDIKPEGFNILVLYWYHPPQYWDYLAQCESYNLRVIKELQQAEIKFSMPVQRVQLDTSNEGTQSSQTWN
ncbi:MAG: mechanosensitive ion channel family protein [Planctomycetes bacterium]|nr:mechanosensitive ion channel family protein [Planctomycetota bacterium]